MKKNNQEISKTIAEKIANIWSIIPLIRSNIKLNIKDNNQKLQDHEFKQLEKEFAMLEIKRKNHIAKKHYETETEIQNTFKLKLLIFFIAAVSTCLTLLGTDVFQNLLGTAAVTEIKSYLTILLIVSVMFLNYYLSANLAMLKDKFYMLFKPALCIVVCCIVVSVYFNFTFLNSILTVENEIIKVIICLFKALLIDIGLSFLLFYENMKSTLTFSYNRNQNIENTKQNITEKKAEKKTVKTENKTTKTDLTFDEKLNMIKNIIDNLADNQVISKKEINHFCGRYDWDKAKKILSKQKIIYIDGKQCKKTAVQNIKVVK